MDRLDQLYARSLREIQAHAGEMADLQTGRYFVDEAAHLLAALRLWAQSHYRTEKAVRDAPPRAAGSPRGNGATSLNCYAETSTAASDWPLSRTLAIFR